MKPQVLDTGVTIYGPSPANIISDEALLEAFGHSNFGEGANHREIILEGLIQASFGYSQGSTISNILVDLKLCKCSTRLRALKITKRGQKYLRAANTKSMGSIAKFIQGGSTDAS